MCIGVYDISTGLKELPAPLLNVSRIFPNIMRIGSRLLGQALIIIVLSSSEHVYDKKGKI